MKRRTFLNLGALTIAGTVVSTETFSQIFYHGSKDEITQIAFLADVHLQDIYGKLSGTDFSGITTPTTNKNVLVRTMASQLRSTRIFNENYFAFLNALNDIAKKGIKLVVLPGDFSDDGQAIHLRGLKKILKNYEKQYDIHFFVITGNHDPSSPFLKDTGKNDFLGANGQNQPVFSKKGMYSPSKKENPVVISPDIAKMGYCGIVNELKDFGFMPKNNFVYWETPFTRYTTENYLFEKAQKAAELTSRTYEILPGYSIPDVSYLVEPINGLWLLAIDGNMYYPKNKNGDAGYSRNYNGSGLGYNNIRKNKKYLFEWIKKVTSKAKIKNKKLIAFSHFPVVDFNDNSTPVLKRLLGENKWQLARVPNENVAHLFADAGITLHVAGHMHINDTGVCTSPSGNTIVNIQTPSLAAYQPAYKILKLHNNHKVEVDTVPIDSVPRFNELFPLYEKEHEFLKSINNKNIWNKAILKCSSYHDFTLYHLKELVRLRFINDWPEPIKSFLTETSMVEIGQKLNCRLPGNAKNYSGYNLLFDFYKLRNADTLALRDISETQKKFYQLLINAANQINGNDKLTAQLKDFFKCMEAFGDGAPAEHFFVDLETGKITG